MQLTFSVPTHHRSKSCDGFTGPEVSVTVTDDHGVRFILGEEGDNCYAPDLLIERRPRGWLIFLHPDGTEDPSGYLFIKDGGKSFVIPGNKFGCAEAIECASLKDYEAIKALINQGVESQQGESDVIDTADERAAVLPKRIRKTISLVPTPASRADE
ncbi:MAG TPA: hypothetical protein VGM05_03625 [Planctomycetaceae bacterium]|jgi:hypothetical protein